MLKSCVYFFYEAFVVPLLHRTSFFTRSDFKMIFQRISAFKIPDLTVIVCATNCTCFKYENENRLKPSWTSVEWNGGEYSAKIMFWVHSWTAGEASIH